MKRYLGGGHLARGGGVGVYSMALPGYSAEEVVPYVTQVPANSVFLPFAEVSAAAYLMTPFCVHPRQHNGHYLSVGEIESRAIWAL